MRPASASSLGLTHLIKHMLVWEQHMERLSHSYIKDRQTFKYKEIQADIDRLIHWRKRLVAINSRGNRENDVPILQGDGRSPVPESSREPPDDTTVH